ncbi:MAG: bifunctional 2-methylcitrate synthase/citrate synthase [Gemmatimonadetes bacterium]|nr:bifunctional 2-methylcitrate synthase/citrate synthase [Gemmatimonadota bacterium]MYC71712.1 bifunctional 2-methylcitrate synthase/citrate synthase [Gemmatimonadota bacterium]MYI63434.1 bifunctional 2-methylcitrate synthase/citrate synthase [Gemmatimonadota bacterium]
MTDKSYSPGLEGVIAGESALSRIDIDINRLILYGYDLVELTENASYEEVAYLLLYGELPTVAELAEFNQQLRSQRDLPGPVGDLLRSAPADAHPMDLLRTAVSSLAFFDAETPDNSHEANVRKSVRLLAKIPTALACGYRFSQGLEPVAPDAELDHAANLLYMLRDEKPPAYEVEAMNTSLILYAEHGYNASTFTARVVASTLADMYAAITAAIGALHGPLHGGANEAAMHMLLEVDSPAAAEQWVLDALAQKKKIMGFGHREYKSGDSRVPTMKKVGRQIAAAIGDTKWPDLADVVEETMVREKGIFPNVDFPCAYTYYMMGIPIPLYTPIFVASRVVGWAAHVIEQHDANRLIRPNHIYTGPEHRAFVALGERG